jgi:hypothetical protein
LAWVNVDIVKAATQLVPYQLRKPLNLAWHEALLAPILAMKTKFDAARRRTLQLVAYTFSKRSMELLLNAEFDLLQNRIYIESTPGIVDTLVLHVQASERPTIILKPAVPPVLRSSYARQTEQDFIVYVPEDLVPFDVAKMAVLVNRYRLVGKDFKIKTIVAGIATGTLFNLETEPITL